jgi:hypothetical protein
MLTIAVEPIAQCGGEVTPLMDALAALAVIPWRAPSLAELGRAESVGLVTFTLRTPSGELVGYCMAKPLQDGATDHGMFILPAHRGTNAAMRMVHFVQSHMRSLGAMWFIWDCDEASRSYALAERLGHRLIGRRYLADLQESHHGLHQETAGLSRRTAS